jgi:nitrate reductase cytochrome c-type subunit
VVRIEYFVAIAIVAWIGCASNERQSGDTAGASRSAQGIADSQIGLSKTSVFDVPDPAPVNEREIDPDDAVAIGVAYAGAPPVIPHAIADLLPIVRGGNECLDCHDDVDAAAPSPAHYTDLRAAPGEIRPEIAGARFVCISCHVSQTTAPVLMESNF